MTETRTPLTSWRAVDMSTGEVTEYRIVRTKRRGRKPTVRTVHGRITSAMLGRAPRGSVRFVLNGQIRAVLAGGCERESFLERVERHRALLGTRTFAQAWEDQWPVGQAASWYADLVRCVPPSGRAVARQLARLCGDDAQVTVPLDSLADAVGRTDSAGRHIAYTQRGIEALAESAWLRTETTGPQGNQETTYYLTPGERHVEWFPEGDDDWRVMRL